MGLTPSSRRRWQNLAVLFGAAAVALVLIEIGFRAWIALRPEGREPGGVPGAAMRMGPRVRPSPDADLVYEYRPGLAGFTNSAGMRGPERAIARPPNTIRIAGLGDSVMAGDHYPAEQTFMGVLERRLNEAATSPTRFETLNFAVGGYNTEQELAALRRKASAYDPDWVILGIVINDIDAPVFVRTRDATGGYLLVDRYQLDAQLPYGIGLDPGRLPLWAHSVFARWLRSRLYWPARWGRFRRAFGEIARFCRENNMRLLAVSLTEDVEVDQKEDPRAAWHGDVRKTARAHGVDLLEMYPAVMEYLKAHGMASYRTFWSGPQDPHPNVEGHRLHAALIYEKLVSLGILKQPPRP